MFCLEAPTEAASRSRMFFRIAVIKNFKNFTGKHRCWGLKACNSIKKRVQHRCFSLNIVKVLRTAFFIELLWWLLLHPSLSWYFLWNKVLKNSENFYAWKKYLSSFSILVKKHVYDLKQTLLQSFLGKTVFFRLKYKKI